MKHKKDFLVLGKILKKIAPKIGAKVLVEPKYGIVCQIKFKNGKQTYFRYNTGDLNPSGASEIARDKDYSNFFMKKMGYPIIPDSKSFFSDQWAKAIGATQRGIDAGYHHAQQIGFPVIVKPNSGSQGAGVALVHNKSEFYRTLRNIFKLDRIALVQSPVHGKDYRLVVLDNKVVSAYERIPLNVVGNGRSNIKKLLELKAKQFIASSRDTKIKIDDPRIKTKLSRQGLSFQSIPKKGAKIFLLDNANLSTGGDSIDVTQTTHNEFKKLAIKLTRAMGLRLCGVDLMVDGDISQKPQTYWVLEINASPGFDHYTKLGKTQEQMVENLYLEILKRIEKSV